MAEEAEKEEKGDSKQTREERDERMERLKRLLSERGEDAAKLVRTWMAEHGGDRK
jgi:flagellar biosynthesis/type III secretory pathway M-ring protein FliF/YscJ